MQKFFKKYYLPKLTQIYIFILYIILYYGKFAWGKVKKQKPINFLYTRNEKVKFEIKTQYHLYEHLKKTENN